MLARQRGGRSSVWLRRLSTTLTESASSPVPRAFRTQPYDDVPVLQRPPARAGFDASALFTTTPITQHSAADAGRYYELDAEQITRFFPEGFTSGLSREFAASNLPAIMVRQSALDARAILESLANDDAALARTSALVLEGSRGVGKSVTLSYLVHAARASGWLVLSVPSAHAYLNRQQRMLPLSELRIEIQIAGGPAELETLFDPISATRALLKGFLLAHEDTLTELPVRCAETSAFARAINGKLESLADLAQLGSSDESLSTHALVVLLRELRAVSEVPVMVAVDECNALVRNTVFKHSQLTVPLHARSFLLPHLLGSAASFGSQLQRGLVLCAESASHTFHPREPARWKKRRQLAPLPAWAGAAAQGEAEVRTIPVPAFSEAELGAALQYYAHAGTWRPAQQGMLSEAQGSATSAARQVHMLTASRGEAVRKLVSKYA